MNLESVTPRHSAAIGLVAFVPVLIYAVTNSVLAGTVSGINLLLIYGSIYVAMSPVEGGHDHDHEHSGTAS